MVELFLPPEHTLDHLPILFLVMDNVQRPASSAGISWQSAVVYGRARIDRDAQVSNLELLTETD